MGNENAVEKCNEIRRKYKEYLKSSYFFGDEKLQKLFVEQLERESLLKGPYIDMQLPFVRGKSISELVSEGVVCKSFMDLGGIDFNRPLYSHQERSIRHVCSGHNEIVTTGTGSGKTESFLFPILNEILKEIEDGNTDSGIRAMFLYPMNALVNDQVERFRTILAKYPKITFGFFTGETDPDMSPKKLAQYRIDNNISSNELVTREEIRNNPPHLLFTNYSMLEFLMIRPNDYAVFTPEKLNYWKFIVLDEAHVYNGALGIELSMLLRRVTGYASKKPRFILTSATLGKQGESENKIIEFGSKLTSAKFDVDDITFSKRIHMDPSLITYAIDPDDYTSIKNNIKNAAIVSDIAKQYGVDTDGHEVNSILFELLKRDSNVHQIYNVLKDGCKLFSDVWASYGNTITVEQLIDLIDLINTAEVNGIRLFDLKYHSFIRPLAGAFVNFADPQNLTLTKTNEIDGYKAFEIGNCRRCNTPYIIGKIQRSTLTGLNYILQNKEIDIYENYGVNSQLSLDFFLFKDDFDTDSKDVTKYNLCVKCGCVSEAANKNALKCPCGKEYERLIYKVNYDVKKSPNNIRYCPKCGNKHNLAIVKNINMGKDEGTALTAQILLESMGNDSAGTLPVKKKGLFSKTKVEETPLEVKQLLEFSDSRQQASFAALFLDKNHSRLLSKRIIWEAIKNSSFKDMSLEELRGKVAQLIKDKDLFDNEFGEQKNAWLTILKDLLRVDGAYDSESLGLYFFKLEFEDLLGGVSDEDIVENFGEYNIDKVEDFVNLINVLFTVFKMTPAINYTSSTLTFEEKEDLHYRRFDNYVALTGGEGRNVRNLLPTGASENMLIRYIKRVCGCDSLRAGKLIEKLFNMLKENDFFRIDLKNKYVQIDADKYTVKNCRTSKYYRCSKCGRLTPFNVHDVCVVDKCDGILSETNPDEELKFNYYRKQYQEKAIERLVVKEHTAQLKTEKAKEYQEGFKNKKINVLSCSTTFEMGVDIGSLEHVFMRNVPPTPANYVQRAGRAGRSANSSAFVLTYCGSGSHDYTYYLEPKRMVAGIINPPYFNVCNDKIISRHLMACAFGFFFRINKELFGKAGTLLDQDLYNLFMDYVFSKPEDLRKYIDEKVIPETEFSEYHNFKWVNANNNIFEKLKLMVETLKENIAEYEKAITAYTAAGQHKDADYCSKQIEMLKNGYIINVLSGACVIPKYGFPVDVVPLKIYRDGKMDNSIDLSRDLKIAISEYAPGSEVIVDKVKFTSNYIIQPKASSFPRHFFVRCQTCKRVNIFLTQNPDKDYICKYCGMDIGSIPTESFIVPVKGFRTGSNKKTTTLKPKRTYSGEVSYLGGGILDGKKNVLGNSITIETSSEDELLVMNKSNFYICQKCGYAKLDEKNSLLNYIDETHKVHTKTGNCSNHRLERTKLGHTFKTDVAKFIIPSLQSDTPESYAMAMSFMYALLEGVSEVFDIERTNIDGVLDINRTEGSYDIILYDNVPGGAGHVKRLLDKEEMIKALEAALRKVSQKCCDENTSCYNCLRNYNNQIYHSRLKRIYAINIIKDLLADIKAF